MVQVHELATELEVPSSKVLEVLAAIGVVARNHMSTISDVDVARVRNALKTKKVSGTLTGKRDFRIRDISTPKSPAVRPRPTLQQSEAPVQQQRKVITRRVIKRVVQRAGPVPPSVGAPGPAPAVEVPTSPLEAGPPKAQVVEVPSKPEVPRPAPAQLPPRPEVPPKSRERPREDRKSVV
jgi:hypothetical protein